MENSFEGASHIPKTKKIELEIYERSEAIFYILLKLIKTSFLYNENDLHSLINCIHYPSGQINFPGASSHHMQIQLAWEYLKKASRDSDKIYDQVCGDNFSDFIDSQFGKAIPFEFDKCYNLLEAERDPEGVKLKTALSVLSLRSIFKEEDLVATRDNIPSIMKISDSQKYEFECFNNNGRKIKKLSSMCDKNGNMGTYYVGIDSIGLFRVECINGNIIISGSPYYWKDSKYIDPTAIFFSPLYGFPIGEGDEYENSSSGDFLKFDEHSGCIELNPDLLNNLAIESKVQSQFMVPSSGRRDSFIRKAIAKKLLDLVTKYYPNLTFHTRTTVAGYLSIPFGVVDSEDRHDQVSTRGSSYHYYVGKTIRNILKSKH